MENQKKSTPNFVWIAAIGVFAIFFLIGILGSGSSSENNFNLVPPPVVGNNIPEVAQQPTATSSSTFSEINQADQNWMREIITGVMQNTTQVTPMLKSELRNIFKKYNATDDEIDNFATYGPAFATLYQGTFYLDAKQAVLSGYPVKSDTRLALEKDALSLGLMTAERVKSNDEEMNLIANHQPITGSDGRQVLLTADMINNTLNNISAITTRLQSLLE